MISRSRKFEFIFLLIGSIILFFLLLSSILNESPVYDEYLHLEAGIGFIKSHDFRIEPFNPPFPREIIALPFIFNSSLIKDPVFLYPRLIVVLFTFLLAIFVYLFAKKIYGKKAGFLAFILFIFEPNILTQGHYATTDMILTFFIFLSIFTYWFWRKSLTLIKTIILSIIIGLALSSKISAIPFLLLSFILIVLIKQKYTVLKLRFYKKNIIRLITIFFVISCTIWSSYFFTFEPLLGFRFDKNRQAIKLAEKNPYIKFALTQPIPLGSYISSIKQIVLYNYSDLYKKDTFLFGKFSSEGFFYYFPLSFLIKSSLPLLILFILSLIYNFKKNNANKYLLIPIIIIFLTMLFSKVNYGVRYILPIFPFIIVYSSQIMKLNKNNLFYKLIPILVLWHVFGIYQVYPHYISFFNELIGDKRNGYKYLIDSNLDWGQGLIELKKYQEKHLVNNLQLAYFGLSQPSNYGIKYERIKDMSLRDKNEIVAVKNNNVKAISATCWYFCGYYKNELLKNKTPKDIVGGSILIFNDK